MTRTKRVRGALAGLVMSGVVLGAALGHLGAPAHAQETPTSSPAPSAAASGGAGGDTAAIAINTKDGFDIFRTAFAIKRAMGDVVDNGNAAVAFASCTECETVAVSIQVVLMMNDPSIVTPTNLAIAINQECMLCETLAAAFQIVLTTDGPVRFTPEGSREISLLRRELLGMRREELSIEEILLRLDALMDRFFRVLREEMVTVEPPAGQDVSDDTPAPEASPTDVTTPSTEPSASASTSPSATPSASSTPSQSP